MKTNIMKLVKNIVLTMAVMISAIVIMPRNVWADNSLSFSETSKSINVGDSSSVSLTYSVDSGCTLSWATVGTNLTNISPSGTLPASPATISFTGGTEGTTVIKAEIKDSTSAVVASAECTITVSNKKIQVVASPSSIDIDASSTLTASGVAPYVMGSTITWEVISGTDVVQLGVGTSATNTVTGKKAGTATIKATDDNGISATCTVTVNSIPATDISVEDESHATTGDIAAVGGTKALTAALTPTNSDSSITWTTGNPSVATVSGSGKSVTVTGVGGGQTTITATANGHSATYNVTVNNPLQSITLNPTTVSVGAGNTATVTITPSPATPYPTVSYAAATSNSSVATASVSGTTVTITGVAAGTATITVTPDGDASKAKQVAVTVLPKVTAVSLTETFITSGKSRTMSKTITPTDAAYERIVFASNNAANVSVNESGVVTGKSGISGSSTATANIKAAVYNYGAPGTSVDSAEVAVTVYGIPTISYNSDRTLSVTLPGKVATGDDTSKNITSVKGAYIVAYLNGNEIGNSGDSYRSKGTSFSVPASFAEGIVSNNQSKFSGETNITFRVFAYGTKESDAGSSVVNSDVYGETSGTVYKTTVSGSGIKGTSVYALNGTSVKLTATPESGYTFSKWEDDTTTNPRTITVDGSKEYKATATKSGSSSGSSGSGSAAGGSSSGKGGSGSGYDKVPKTGEGNGLIYMWILFGVCIAVAGIAVYVGMNPDAFKKSKDKKN